MKKIFFLLLLIPNVVSAQYLISGKVSDQNGQALPGVTVRLTPGFLLTATDENGLYKINAVSDGSYVLQFSSMGYATDEMRVKVQGADVSLNITMKESSTELEMYTVNATRASEESGVAHTNVSKEDIAKNNVGIDLPYLVDQTPSVVVTSDAGTGIGYTGIRIRGSDPTRVNVSLNGIPVNDAESQGVWWVNMPDFASSTDNIQIQRGVGTSTNGAGAFGGSMNLQTNVLHELPYAEMNNAFGSFQTRKHTLKAGTGLISGKFTFDMRLSQITSDGFVDRATSNLKSFYTSSAWYGDKTSLRLNIFSGKEKTYQSWNGVPSALLKGDSLGIQDYIFGNGLYADQIQNLYNSDPRTFNLYTYENETDNYRQDHYQLFFNHQLNAYWLINAAGYFTHGEGYYEQYKRDHAFADYGLNDFVVGSDTLTSTNLIRQLWLDNDVYGFIASLHYAKGKLESVLGGGWNKYEGLHFGEIVWMENASNASAGYRWYENIGTKTDGNVYWKTNYRLNEKFSAYADLQLRSIRYQFLGYDRNMNNVTQTVDFLFFNPKAGMNFKLDARQKVYASFGVGNKEPNRDDLTNSTPDSRPLHETLFDYEAGYRFSNAKVNAGLNAYFMQYKNQLVLTGKINDVGAYTRVNIENSYRAGLELDFAWKISRVLHWQANATFSQNKISDYTEYIDNWDTWGQDSVYYAKSDLAFSPNFVSGSEFTFTAWETYRKNDQGKAELRHKVDVSWISKYVGKQFIDNTSDATRALDAYWVNDVRLSYTFVKKKAAEIRLNVLMRNVLNEVYESNAWVYRYYYAGSYRKLDGYFPQAGRNFLVGLDIRF